jgi:ComF family protein
MLIRTFNFFSHFIHDAIAPAQCASCQVLLPERDVFCASCAQRIQLVGSVDLVVTATKRVPIYAVGAYTDPLKKLINAKSFSQRAASAQLGELAARHALLLQKPIDVLVPIPLHWTRYAWRGYNQSEEIARVVAKARCVPLCNELVRRRKTEYQAECSRAERTFNVLGAFALSDAGKKMLKGKHVALVDDVFTTGATMEAAARAIYAAKPASVCALVVARTV